MEVTTSTSKIASYITLVALSLYSFVPSFYSFDSIGVAKYRIIIVILSFFALFFLTSIRIYAVPLVIFTILYIYESAAQILIDDIYNIRLAKIAIFAGAIILYEIECIPLKIKNFYCRVLPYLLALTIAYTFTCMINDESTIFRPHAIVQFVSYLLLAGFTLNIWVVSLVCMFILSLSLFSYESRLMLGCGLLLLFYRFGAIRTTLLGCIFIFLGNTENFFPRLTTQGMEEVGRSEIFSCYYDNISNIHYFRSSFNNLLACNSIYEYSHSSIIEFAITFGIIPVFFALIFVVIYLLTSLLKKECHNEFYGCLLLALYGFFEGGVEIFYMYLIVRAFLKRSVVPV